MANRLDLSRLRDQTMGSGVDEEAVTVNTRALVDKILARYSGEYTTIRELIQNAADAKAGKVTIRLDTVPSRNVPVPQERDQSTLVKHALLHHTMSRMVISNNGEAFGAADWARLKRIAEGNPDETKIGAFGVGFYSVFADSEEPFVVSGRRTMAFYWKNNSLFTKSGELPTDQSPADTQFLLNYRNEDSAVPDLLSLCTFLTTSLTFVDLEEIELFLDEWRIFALKKKKADGVSVPLPPDIKTKTAEGMMKVASVVNQSSQIDAQWMNVLGWKPQQQWQTVPTKAEKSSQSVGGLSSLFSKFTSKTMAGAAAKAIREKEAAAKKAIEEDLTGYSRATAFLRISTVNVQTNVKPQFARDLERATKKPPPKATRIELLSSSFDEASAFASTISGAASNKATELFASVLTSKSGRVFIGFPTKQTTGLLCHISAPSVIPTVEREAIDLNADSVRTWNQEMLRVAGIACRVSYAGDMAQLKRALTQQAGGKAPSKADIDAVVPKALHMLKQYTATDTTPDSRVGKIIQEAFWSCGSAAMEILSTKGVLPCKEVRILSQTLTFLDNVPSIPEAITKDANEFVYKLHTAGYLSELTVKDMQKELESRALDERQLVQFLKWAVKGLNDEDLDAEVVHRLFRSAVANLSDETKPGESAPTTRLLTLDQIETFQLAGKIPQELPVPPTTMPFRIIKDIPPQQLEAFGWAQLQVVPWLRFILSNAHASQSKEKTGVPNMRQDAVFAAKVLVILSKQWEALSHSSRGSVVEMLSNIPVIPTKLGLRKPTEAYFTSVKIFDDLPTIEGLQGVKEKLLVALGVRKTIELTVVFDRLLARDPTTEQSKWSFADLVRYLVSVQNDIPKKDLDKLRTAPICPIADVDAVATAQPKLVPVTELYRPNDQLRILKLPVLRWDGTWRDGSVEAKFLRSLGLRPFPSAVEVAHIMQKAGVQNNARQYTNAMNYFLTQYDANDYRRAGTANLQHIPFLKAEGLELTQMVTPSDCFSNPRAAILGFRVLPEVSRSYADRFGVLPDPSVAACADKVVRSPPKLRREAIDVFGYLATRLPHFDDTTANKMSTAPIVPVAEGNDDKGRGHRWIPPKTCFLGHSDVYGNIFDFVDFGEEANFFLLRIGAKHEPSTPELARMLVDTPAKMLGILQTSKYLDLLRRLADNLGSLKSDKELFRLLKTRPFLIAYREVPVRKSSTSGEKTALDGDEYEDDDAPTEREVSLQSADRIVLLDSFREYGYFREHLLVPPADDTLEGLYAALGVQPLSAMIETDTRIGNPIRDQSEAAKLMNRILERTRLFVYDYPKDSIHHDAAWIEKSLSIIAVDHISIRVSLKGYRISFTEKRTVAVTRQQRSSYTMAITRINLYELSEQLCGFLLKRPKKTDAMALEMLLQSDLRSLKHKGYNVDRILRRKETEARIAEEHRQKQLAEERRLQEANVVAAAEAARSQLDQQVFNAHANGGEVAPPPPYEGPKPQPGSSPAGQLKTPKASMPGAFGSPDNETPNVPRITAPQSFLSRLGNQLGYNSHSGNADGSSGGATGGGTRNVKGTSTQGVTDPRAIQRNLTNAIKACRPHGSDSLFSDPTVTQVEEAKGGSYCDFTDGQSIDHVSTAPSGMKIYLAKRLAADTAARTAFLSGPDAAGTALFGELLRDLAASVFGLAAGTVHIYHDPASRSIAFNLRGALFCNYHYFKSLHLPALEAPSGDPAARKAAMLDAVSYWWVTLCHELAHNLAQQHGAEHSFYMESFASGYFARMVERAAQY